MGGKHLHQPPGCDIGGKAIAGGLDETEAETRKLGHRIGIVGAHPRPEAHLADRYAVCEFQRHDLAGARGQKPHHLMAVEIVEPFGRAEAVEVGRACHRDLRELSKRAQKQVAVDRIARADRAIDALAQEIDQPVALAELDVEPRIALKEGR